jgi:hypothetical protein
MFPYQELQRALMLDLTAAVPAHSFGAPISSDMDIKTVRVELLSRSFFKKLLPSGKDVKCDELALEKFLEINSSISTNPFEYPAESEVDSLFWDYFKDNFLKATSLGDVECDVEFIGSHLTAGPGASKGCDNESFYTKVFASRISCSDDYLLALYRAAISGSDTWAEAERLRFERFGVEIASSNRLFFVPKTADISRTCCTEPLVNMLIQQSIGAFLEISLARNFGISLKTQPENNRKLALIGSVDGSFGTIDLRSASDSISWALVQRICPQRLLGLLTSARCERTVLPDGSEIALNMISTMGNGFTFPLQTVIFACVVRSVYQLMNLSSYCPKTQFGVFGDDIIVRREAYDFVCRCLRKLGFQVNDDKSFNTGAFRESCGSDFYNGHYVRGIYIKSLETVPDLYSAFNRLVRWSAMSGVPLLNSTKFLRGRLSKQFEVPFSEAIDCGIQTPFRFSRPRVTDSYWFAYRKLTNISRKRQVPFTLEESARLGYRYFNPYGLELAFLGGYARSEVRRLNSADHQDLGPIDLSVPKAYFMLRHVEGVSRIKVTRGSIPFWDWLGPKVASEFSLENNFSFGDWEVAFAATL